MSSNTKKTYKYYPKKYPKPSKNNEKHEQRDEQNNQQRDEQNNQQNKESHKESHKYETKKPDYKRPAETFTDKLTDGEIMNLLEDYEKVTDISQVDNGVSIKYFLKDDDNPNAKPKFRMGGTLINKEGLPDYIMLTTGKFTWSVQMKTAILYRKIPNKSIKAEYEKILAEKNSIIDELVARIKVLMEENEKYKSMNENNEKPIKKTKRK